MREGIGAQMNLSFPSIIHPDWFYVRTSQVEGTCGNKAYPEGILLMALSRGHHLLPTGALMTPADQKATEWREMSTQSCIR